MPRSLRAPVRARWVATFVALAMLISLVSTAGAASNTGTVDIQFLNVSDWHAQLDPVSVTGVGNVGGAAVISSYWKADRALNPNTLTLTAGDAYGAAPPLSNYFNEEPAVRAMRLMGVDVDTFGNHNFDRGITHLQSMINLATADASTVPGKPFSYLSTNLKNLSANLNGVDKMKIFNIGKVKIAVIGVTNPEAPTLVSPGNFGSIIITDPVAEANKTREVARRAGAQIVVAITHMGVTGFADDAKTQPFGPLVDFANSVSGFDVIFGDHTDIQYKGFINNALVLENFSKGVSYAKTTVTVDRSTGKVTGRATQFVTPLSSAVTPDAAIEAMLQPYREALKPIFNVVVGNSSRYIPRADACGTSNGRTCESLVGNTTADAIRLRYAADFAITNSGGLRADLTCPVIDNPSDFCPAYVPLPFPITRGQVNTVLPFGNVVVTLNITGAELKASLENGVSRMPGVDGRFPQVSGLCVTYDIAAPAGSRLTNVVRTDANGNCTTTVVDLSSSATYTFAENDFMAKGGDGYPNLYSRVVTRDIMDQVLADYLTANNPISPLIQGRVTCTDSNGTTAPNCPVVTP